MSTVSSTSSASTEADQFRGAVEYLMLSDVATETYVERAEELINALGSRKNPNQLAPEWYKKCQARFDAILSAMLQFSVECGGNTDNRGERSRRYVACAIVASTRGTKTSDDTHRALSDPAIIWFSHLLWMFKGNSSYKIQTILASGEATPTLRVTRRYEQLGALEARELSMKERVLNRQGYRCPLTGIPDKTMPGPPPKYRVILRCAHILPRAVAVFPPAESISELEKTRYRFAMSTLDILAYYMAITHDQVVAIIADIDSPANGIAMETNYHDAFDLFELCLVPTDQADVYDSPANSIAMQCDYRDAFDSFEVCLVPSDQADAYKIKFYMHGTPACISAFDQVIFRDETASNIPLPNPDLIRLHAALCGVLHVSGAGKDIDVIFEDLEHDGKGSGPPGRIFSSGFQFLEHMEARTSVRAMLGISKS